jgi:hypothetical protein
MGAALAVVSLAIRHHLLAVPGGVAERMSGPEFQAKYDNEIACQQLGKQPGSEEYNGCKNILLELEHKFSDAVLSTIFF